MTGWDKPIRSDIRLRGSPIAWTWQIEVLTEAVVVSTFQAISPTICRFNYTLDRVSSADQLAGFFVNGISGGFMLLSASRNTQGIHKSRTFCHSSRVRVGYHLGTPFVAKS
jgi:putative Mn2+ efflux pump MntP